MNGWESITLEVQTPMFMDGPRDVTEVRPPSIRGAARFWLRALVGGVVGGDLDRIAAVESAVFGSTENSSPVQFRVPRQPRITNEPAPAFLTRSVAHDGQRFQGVAYLLGPGLCEHVKGVGFQLKRGFVAPGERFELRVRRHPSMSDEAWFLAQVSLWLVVNVGGLGARTHRGFGSVRVADRAAGSLPNVQMTTPGKIADSLKLIQRAAEPRVTSLLGGGSASAGVGVPALPTLAAVEAHVGQQKLVGAWDEMLAGVGLDYRLFRANSQDQQGARYRPPVKTEEWLQVIHGPHRNHFPIGALGLPIIFKKGQEVNAVADGEPRRWPSPLSFKLVGPAGAQRLLSIAFMSELLPAIGDAAPQVQYRRVGAAPRRLSMSRADLQMLAETWFKVSDGANVRRPLP